MNDEPKRRFFSGDSLQQALVQAAIHYNLEPDQVAYRSIEKKHGFLKVRRKVVIEVDPGAPKRERAAQAGLLPPASAAPATPQGDLPPAAPAEPRAVPERGERHGRPERRQERERGGPRGRGERGGGNREPQRGDRPGMLPPLRREPSAIPASRWEDVQPMQPSYASDLIALPETPRRTAERFPPAEGPQAEAAAKGAELLLRVSGLELSPRVLQGEDRLEVDLTGPDVDWCFADDGELVLAIEHLLPRLIRTMGGEPTLVRVDCDNFQEIREERLRSLAQRVAEEVRRRGKPRVLEPMNPADRRIIHVTLADDPAVVTESEGDGYFKRVAVKPV